MIPKARRRRISSTRAIPASLKKKRGPKPRPVIELPEAKSVIWADRDAFHEALAFHIERHGDTVWHLHKAITGSKHRVDRKTIAHWVSGTKVPRSVTSLELLGRIERRYQLPVGYFASKLPHADRAASGHTKLGDMKPSERRRIAWHLPSDFDRRPLKERREILAWVRKVIVSGATDYRLYQAAAMRQRYALRFPDLVSLNSGRSPELQHEADSGGLDDVEVELAAAKRDAPRRLTDELAHLVRFKTATLTEIGYQRNGVWNEGTALQKVDHLGLLFGAMAADPEGPVAGFGVPLAKLTMALLVFPAVWDWYVQWRERRRGFYTIWEVNMIQLGLALTRAETGWLRQRPDLARMLRPIPGLVSQDDIDRAVTDWEVTCDAFYQHGMVRAKEIQRVARVHRDTFEPIMAVLEADSPVGEYRRIADEVVRLMPRKDRYPKAAAEAVRSFLMIRLGLHLGVRQKNLRELLFCSRHEQPLSERQLEMRRCGEMRWNDKEKGWEVLIPAVAFKNANSSFFAARPFRLILPDVGDLYRYIGAWIRDHRAALLNGAKDPGTFFIKTVKSTSQNAAYGQSSFYEAWRLIIQRYGIYNPYTGRGAIKGLLPHGPHSVRDVLATHVLKETGSYEQAGYAIQDTAEIDTHSRKSIHAFEFAPQDWQSLAAQNARERHLRAPCCQAEIILRRSKLGTQHFVHRFRGACTSAPESEDHRQVKRVIVEAARANGWHAEAEFDGLSSDSEPWRADVLLTKGRVRIAIEVQWSKQSQEETARRQSRYASSGVRGLWLFRQARFDASEDIPAVRISGNPLDGYDVFVPTGAGEQALPLSSFISAALNRQYQFGLPLGAPADVEVRCGNLDCWKCGAETRIITGLDISIGPHRLSATIPDLGNCLDLVRRTLQAIPAQASLGRIMHRNSREAGSRYLSNGCTHCGALIGAHYEYQAWDHQDVVARFPTVVDERMRQLAIDLGDEPGWGVHRERTTNREPSPFDRV